MTWIFHAIPNVLKSCIIQEIHARMLTKYNTWNEDK